MKIDCCITVSPSFNGFVRILVYDNRGRARLMAVADFHIFELIVFGVWAISSKNCSVKEERNDLLITKLNWSTGIIIVTKK